MSNHPKPLAGLEGMASTNVRQQASTSSVATPVNSSSRPSAQVASIPTHIVRDELVRAVMPELQVLLQHLVETAVGRALAPLLDKQHELETALKDLHNAQLRTESSSNSREFPAREPVAIRATMQTEIKPFAAPAAPAAPYQAVNLPAIPEVSRATSNTRGVALNVNTYDTSTLADIPSELNGSRRKKVVIWMFALIMVLFLISAVGFSALSNMGTYF